MEDSYLANFCFYARCCHGNLVCVPNSVICDSLPITWITPILKLLLLFEFALSSFLSPTGLYMVKLLSISLISLPSQYKLSRALRCYSFLFVNGRCHLQQSISFRTRVDAIYNNRYLFEQESMPFITVDIFSNNSRCHL